MEASAAKIFRKGTPSFFLLAPRFFFTSTSEVALREKRGKRGRRKKRERMNFLKGAAKDGFLRTGENAKMNFHTKKRTKKDKKEKEGD